MTEWLSIYEADEQKIKQTIWAMYIYMHEPPKR